MKKHIYLLFLIFCAFAASAQSGEVTTNGIVYPRYTTANRPTGALTPGTTIFNTTLNTHQYYNGSTWVSITNATGNSPWTLSGNSIHNNSGRSIGINSSKPAADLEVQGGGGLLVTLPYTVTTSPPVAPVTMPYNGTLPNITAPAGRILDPGGTGNYITNTAYSSYIRLTPTGTTSGFRLTFESLDLGNGGTIIISTSSDPNNQPFRILLINSYSNYATDKPFLISGSNIYIHFIIGSGTTSAPGFQLLYEQVTASSEGRIYSEPIDGGLSYSSFRNSFSTGSSKASGNFSTAMGFASTASGPASMAIGERTIASGNFSTAMGYYTIASGWYSTAMGISTTASGDFTTAMGSRVSTDNMQGSFIIGDSYSSSTLLSAANTNAFYARFRNGYYLYTTANNTNGVRVVPNGTSWSTLSDSTKKERFIAANHENVLGSVAAMRVGTWNYKGDTTDRHWGVMAQDFYKHFGKDQYGTIGNDTTIATADFDGVAFAAIKGLEERTRELKVNSEKLTVNGEQLRMNSEKLKTKSEKLEYVTDELIAKSEKLERENAELKERLEKLEALLNDTVTQR